MSIRRRLQQLGVAGLAPRPAAAAETPVRDVGASSIGEAPVGGCAAAIGGGDDSLDAFVTEQGSLGALAVRRARYRPDDSVGRARVGDAATADWSVLALLALDPRLADTSPTKVLLLDTETTGLSSGAGSVAFLVGLATVDAAGVVEVEQLLVRDLSDERAMLARVREAILEADLLVTFNGKSFDLPLLRTRFVLSRLEPPREPPHLDLLHVVRRVHAGRMARFTLTAVERAVLEHARVDDVDSAEIPARYLHFLRTGDGSGLVDVVRHNEWDVVAMAALVGLYGVAPRALDLESASLVGVARTLKRAGALDLASAVATRALEEGAGPDARHARAFVAKAQRDRDGALADFEVLAREVDDPSVRLELAKLYEHHLRHPERALACVAAGTGESTEATASRRSRLERKVAKSGRAAPLAQKKLW